MNHWPPSWGPDGVRGPQTESVPITSHENTNPSEQTQTWQQSSGVNDNFNNGVTMNLPDQTAMWRSNYLDDSGYNSGSTTRAASTSGQNCDFNNQQLTDNWNQTSTSQTPSTQLDTTHSQQILVLIQLLNDPDRTLVSQGATIASNLSKTDPGARAISNSPQVVGALVRAISTSRDDETTAHAAATLHHLSQHEHGLRAIFDSGGTFALVALLSSRVEKILNYSLVALHNLLVRQQGSKMAVRLANGPQQMVALLRRNNAKFLAVVTECLKILAFGDQQNKLIILASRGPAELVRILRTHNYEKLLWTTSRALRVLSVCPSNKLAIVEAGGMQALSLQLNHQSQRLVQNCLWTLRNLSDVGRTVEPIDGLLRHCVRFLGSIDVAVVSCAAGILGNLTCNNERNKVVVCRMNGINALVATVISSRDHAEVIEPAMWTLAQLTANYAGTDSARSDANAAIPTLVRILNAPTSRWPVIKVAVDVIRNLAICPVNRAYLRDEDAIPRLVQLLVGAHGEIERCRLCVEGVRMEDVVVGTATALRSLASEPHGRTIIRSLNGVAVLQRMARGRNENFRGVANKVLSELMARDFADDLMGLGVRGNEDGAEEFVDGAGEAGWPQLEWDDVDACLRRCDGEEESDFSMLL